MATVTWAATITADAPTWSPSLSGLANGSYALSSVIDNTSGLYENAVFNLVLPSSITASATAPYIGIWLLYAYDGSTFPNPPGASAGATGVPQTAVVPALSGASFTSGGSGRMEVLPFKFKVLLLNATGTALPSSGTFVATLTRFGETIA